MAFVKKTPDPNAGGKLMMKKYGITGKDNIVTAGKKIESVTPRITKLLPKKGKK